MPMSRIANRWTAPAAAAVLSASAALAQAPANPNDVYDILNQTQEFAPDSRTIFAPAGVTPADSSRRPGTPSPSTIASTPRSAISRRSASTCPACSTSAPAPIDCRGR